MEPAVWSLGDTHNPSVVGGIKLIDPLKNTQGGSKQCCTISWHSFRQIGYPMTYLTRLTRETHTKQSGTTLPSAMISSKE